MNINLEFAQIITISSVCLVVIGWFVNQWLNRRNEILRARREYRVDMCRKFLELSLLLKKSGKQDTDYQYMYELMYEVNHKLQLYGIKDEYIMFKNFEIKWNNFVTNQNDETLKEVSNSINDLSSVLSNGLRKELKIGKLYER